MGETLKLVADNHQVAWTILGFVLIFLIARYVERNMREDRVAASELTAALMEIAKGQASVAARLEALPGLLRGAMIEALRDHERGK